MNHLIVAGFLFAVLLIGHFIFYWSSLFKKLGDVSLEEINEDEIEADRLNESEAKSINYFGTIVFVVLGIIVWSYMAVAVGNVTSYYVGDSFIRWPLYIISYFVFLRFPYGVSCSMIQEMFDFEKFPEKVFFSFSMIIFYILSICCYDLIPKVFKLHISLLTSFL